MCAQEDYKSGVNMYKGAKGTDHAIQIAGWGTDNGVDYWLGRNSWGTYWGEHGWFRIARDAYKPEACCKCIRSLCVLFKAQKRLHRLGGPRLQRHWLWPVRSQRAKGASAPRLSMCRLGTV